MGSVVGVGRSTLTNPRFRSDETLCLPISLQALSDCFAYMAKDVSGMLSALRYHYGEPKADAANDA